MSPGQSTSSESAKESPFEDPDRPLAFLVDGDNSAAQVISQMLDEASKYGISIIRRVYGDWTSPALNAWKPVLQQHAITPEQQFAYTTGKNATDSSLIIDAMDILHSGKVRGFCIASSDSDYTRLATRIREEGMFVMGIGRAQTPAAFRNACNVFVAIENISAPISQSSSPTVPSGEATTPPVHQPATGVQSAGSPAVFTVPRTSPNEARPILRRAFDTVVGPDGWAHLATLGAGLLKLDPAFDSRTYGCRGLLALVQKLPDLFEIRRPAEPSDPRIYVRLVQEAQQ